MIWKFPDLRTFQKGCSYLVENCLEDFLSLLVGEGVEEFASSRKVERIDDAGNCTLEEGQTLISCFIGLASELRKLGLEFECFLWWKSISDDSADAGGGGFIPPSENKTEEAFGGPIEVGVLGFGEVECSFSSGSLQNSPSELNLQ